MKNKIDKHLAKKNRQLITSIDVSLIGKVCLKNDTELIILLEKYSHINIKSNQVGLFLFRGMWYDNNPLDINSYGKSYGRYNGETIIGNYKTCTKYIN